MSDPLINRESLAAAQGLSGQAQASTPNEPSVAADSTAEASAVAPAAAPATAEATPADPAPAEAAATAATTAEAHAADAGATAVPAAPGVAVDAPAGRTRTRILAGVRRFLRFAFALALFAAGILAGVDLFLRSQPVAAPVGDPAVNGVSAPAVVTELAAAINNDDADRIRSALAPEVFGSYTAEMERDGIVSVDGVETLGTYADGPRTATALVILGRTADGTAFAINLVVLAQDGQIVRLR